MPHYVLAAKHYSRAKIDPSQEKNSQRNFTEISNNSCFVWSWIKYCGGHVLVVDAATVTFENPYSLFLENLLLLKDFLAS
jgi:hypothetical protein